MADPFEYDVFLSFSSADEQIAKPIWQELTSNGLRVFWSDTTLKKDVGNSWFEVIERSLERSRHLLLICSDNSMNSKWVQREYRAFYDQCYSSNTRRLVPLLVHGFKPGSLPLFLRGLQVESIDNPDCIQALIPLLGGVNIEKLLEENKHLQETVRVMNNDLEVLKKSLTQKTSALKAQETENKELKTAVTRLNAANDVLGREVENFRKQFKALKNNKEPEPPKIRRQKEETSVPQPQIKPQEKIKEPSPQPREPGLDTLLLWNTLHKRIDSLRGLFTREEFVPNKTVYVDNLAEEINNDELLKWFSRTGKVTTVWVVTDRSTGHSLGFGFVVMSTPEEARAAVLMFLDQELGGRKVTVMRLSDDPINK